MVDFRSLIEFCRTLEQQRNMRSSSSRCRRQRSKSVNPLFHPFCEHSLLAAIDAVVLLLVLGALGVLMLPCFKFLFHEASQLFPATFDLIGGAICGAPAAYAAGFVLAFAAAIAMWEIADHRSRKCGNPRCRGLRRKSAEFDIQLEPEECVRCSPHVPEEVLVARPLELGEDQKELEAELKKMAPLNGRTVLIYRAPCGCPEGRMEVWGPKKPRRIKK